MADTTIIDAVVFPQDDGTGVSNGDEDYDSAGYLASLARYAGDGSYVGGDSTGSPTLQFANIDTANEEVDIQPGHAFILESGHIVQSGSQKTYDTNLPDSVPYVVILPSSVTNVPLDTDVDNDVWLAVDPTSNDSVYIRSGNGLSAPSDPSVKLGTVNSSTGSTTRPNDLADHSVDALNATTIDASDTVTGDTVDATTTLTDAAGVSHTGELEDINHGSKHEDGGSDEISVGGLSGDLADPQDPKAHAASHSADSADEISVENLSTTGSADTVPISQGDGTLSMGSIVPTDLQWREDSNSPQTDTNVGTSTYTIADTFDEYLIRVQVFEESSAPGTVELRAEGNSQSSYDYISEDGTTTSAATSIPCIELQADSSTISVFGASGRFSGQWEFRSQPNTSTNLATAGFLAVISSPLGSLELFRAANNFSVTWEVFGRDIGPAGVP
ncbi:hypothetical protein HFTV1-gp42 [Haloferax tailed virus 1]|uniref:Uncharacterized protein n=2 Tax=Haloferax tailed virus 1 TaxID=2507575 RepID=A0A410N721_HFTV1|nr:hypothetical protein M1M17_gp42 [Haloferax tailed virus 1]QAS68875.1 hypothetical protein HFTV1-gp42 [Haloferax tailed virus 1]